MSSPGKDCSASIARGGYIDPNWPRPNDDSSACIIIYGYIPSMALCGLALALFAIALGAHVRLLYKHRTWYFVPMTVGLVMELVGYVGRSLSSQKNPYSVTYFVIQYFFVVVAPVMFSAAIYTILTIVINKVGRQYSPVNSKVILYTFVASDIIATIVQVTGAALIGKAYSDDKSPSTPNNILLAGLAFQVFTFLLFIIIFVTFAVRTRHISSRTFKIFAGATFVATLAVYLRTIFRLAETAQGLMHDLSTHEVYFGCLEFAPIVVAVYIFVWWHPGRWMGSMRSLVETPDKAVDEAKVSRSAEEGEQEER